MPGGNNAQMAKVMKDIKGRVYGKIVDADTQKPVEYASVRSALAQQGQFVGRFINRRNGDFSIDNNLSQWVVSELRSRKLDTATDTSKFYIQLPNKIEVDLGDIA